MQRGIKAWGPRSLRGNCQEKHDGAEVPSGGGTVALQTYPTEQQGPRLLAFFTVTFSSPDDTRNECSQVPKVIPGESDHLDFLQKRGLLGAASGF